MKKIIKPFVFGISTLLLSLGITSTVYANDDEIKNDIDTSLEYQVNSNGSSMRFISTLVLNNNRTLDDITSIDMDFSLTKDGVTKLSKTKTTTRVYESISGENGKNKADNTYYAVYTITDLNDEKTHGWSITPKFTYHYSDNSFEEVDTSSWLIGGKRQYFVQQYEDWGTDLYYYLFGANGNNGWPGKKMNIYDSTNHIYYFDYLPDANYTTVVFNSGSDTHKTNDIPLSSVNDYYVQQDGDAFAHPTSSHNYVVNFDENTHWHECSVCGHKKDEEGHTLTGITEGNIRTVSCSECEYSVSFDKTILYVTRNWDDWTNLHVYMWNSEGKLNNWPGTAMTFDHTNEKDEEVYRITIPSNAEYIQINNGNNGKQTENIKLADFENYNALYFVWREEQNQVNGYLYIPE